MNNNDIAQIVINWYKKENFAMPWRANSNPYKIWISEIMLQQTQVNTVIPYYIKWLKKFPTINLLATAKIDDVLKCWEGLGYYSRAHNLHNTAKVIIKKYNGRLPNNYSDLIKLKGIGDYTASAILSIAFKMPQPVFDGNIRRVFSRLFILKEDSKIIIKAKKEMLKYMQSCDPSDINQAMMDFGRLICSPKKPQCNICVLNQLRKAYIANDVLSYPQTKQKQTKPTYDVVVGFIIKDNKMLISKRKKNKQLGGLWELPGGKKKKKERLLDCLKREILEELDIQVDKSKKIGKIKHQYSHFNINLTGFQCHYHKGIPKPLSSDEIKWIKFNEIKDFAFPASTLKLFTLYEAYNRHHT